MTDANAPAAPGDPEKMARGWLYLAAILDLYSRRVVGWATSSANDRPLALDALKRATVARKPPAGLIHHSDRRQRIRER